MLPFNNFKKHKPIIMLVLGFLFGNFINFFNEQQISRRTAFINRKEEETISDLNKPDAESGIAYLERSQKELRALERQLIEYLYDTVRILCLIMTSGDNFEERRAVVESWGPRCNLLLFVVGDAPNRTTSTLQLAPRILLVKLPMLDNYKNLWKKTKLALKHAFDNYKNDFDWIIKADDDSYIFMENLRLYLSSKHVTDKEYYGVPFSSFNGYNSGGAGYVISKHNLQTLFTQHWLKIEPTNLQYSNETRWKPEDVQIGDAMRLVDVYAADTRDDQGRFRFLPFSFKFALEETRRDTLPLHWFQNYTKYPMKFKYECCSDSLVGVHYMTPEKMRTVELIAYKRGAQIIGIIEAICLGISLLNSLIRMGQYGSVYGGQLAGTIISNIISGIAIGLMLYGLKKERPGFLLPHLVLQVVGMIAMLVIAIVVIVALAIGSGEMIAGFIGQNSEQLSQHDRDVIASAVVIAGVICIVMLVICVAFQIWFFTVILAAYKFLKEKEMYVPKQVTMPVMQNDAPPPYPGYQTQYNKQ